MNFFRKSSNKSKETESIVMDVKESELNWNINNTPERNTEFSNADIEYNENSSLNQSQIWMLNSQCDDEEDAVNEEMEKVLFDPESRKWYKRVMKWTN